MTGKILKTGGLYSKLWIKFVRIVNCFDMKTWIVSLIIIVAGSCSKSLTDSNYSNIDSDLDGLNDHRDACPDEAGSIFNLGCPNKEPKLSLNFDKDKSTDSDLDGVPDYKDQCVFTYGSPFNQGCPMIEEVD